MKLLLQRVTEASVNIDEKEYSKINQGLLVLLGIHEDDTKEKADWMIQKMINLRIFSDAVGKMNLSVKDISGEILIVSQFTLYGDASKGNRPSFITAAKPEVAILIYEYFIQQSEVLLPQKVKTGQFGADMKISLINDGPVTIIIEK